MSLLAISNMNFWFRLEDKERFPLIAVNAILCLVTVLIIILKGFQYSLYQPFVLGFMIGLTKYQKERAIRIIQHENKKGENKDA